MVQRTRYFTEIFFLLATHTSRRSLYFTSIETSLAPVNDANLQPQNKVDFVELRMPKQTNQDSDVFIPDIIIRKDSVSIEISNTASSELLSKIGGLLHA